MRPNCPTPKKQRHSDKGAAEKAIKNFRRSTDDLISPDMHAYLCVCGWWHVGHSKVSLDRRIRDALRKAKA